MIELNIQRDERDASTLQEDEDRDRKEREERADEIRRLEEEERLEREQDKRAIIEQLVRTIPQPSSSPNDADFFYRLKATPTQTDSSPKPEQTPQNDSKPAKRPMTRTPRRLRLAAVPHLYPTSRTSPTYPS